VIKFHRLLVFIINQEPVIIYKTTNLINGRVYVGKDKHNNPTYFGSGTLITQAISKYGKNNFRKDILEECSDEDVLSIREQYWIAELKTLYCYGGYNLTTGGEGGDTFTHKPDYLKSKTRDKLSESAKRSQNLEYRIKMSSITKSRWEDPIYRNRVTNSLKEKYSNESFLKEFKECMKEVCNTPEMKTIRSENAKGSKNSTWKGYADLYSPENTFIKRYECIGYLKKDVQLSYENAKELRAGATEIVVKSSRKRKNVHENYRIRIVK
jgi:group I intron endonuclease